VARKKYSAEFKTKVILEAIKGGKTTSQFASRFGSYSAQVRKLKRQMYENTSILFETRRKHG
jgi:transposase